MSPVRGAFCAPETEAALNKVQSVAAVFADFVKRLPLNQRGINAALHDEVFDKKTDIVLAKRSGNGRFQPEAF